VRSSPRRRSGKGHPDRITGKGGKATGIVSKATENGMKELTEVSLASYNHFRKKNADATFTMKTFQEEKKRVSFLNQKKSHGAFSSPTF